MALDNLDFWGKLDSCIEHVVISKVRSISSKFSCLEAIVALRRFYFEGKHGIWFNVMLAPKRPVIYIESIRFSVQEFMFSYMGLSLPFTTLRIGVLNVLNVFHRSTFSIPLELY